MHLQIHMHACMFVCVCEHVRVHSPVFASASNGAYLYPCTCVLPGLYRRVPRVQGGPALDGAQLLPDWRHHPFDTLPTVDAQSRRGVRCGQGLQDARGQGEEKGAGTPAKGGAPAAAQGHIHIHAHIRAYTCTYMYIYMYRWRASCGRRTSGVCKSWPAETRRSSWFRSTTSTNVT